MLEKQKCTRCNRSASPGSTLCRGHMQAFRASGRARWSLWPYPVDTVAPPNAETIKILKRALNAIPSELITIAMHTNVRGARGHGCVTLWRVMVAQELLDVPTYSAMRRLLLQSEPLRNICGMRWKNRVPSIPTMSRFAKRARIAIQKEEKLPQSRQSIRVYFSTTLIDWWPFRDQNLPAYRRKRPLLSRPGIPI